MATYTLESQQTAITTATTTTVMSAPAASTTEHHAKSGWATIRNKGGTSNTITILKVGTATVEKSEFTLAAGEDYVLPFDVTLRGTGQSLQLVTSSTSAIDVDISYTKRVE